jgi:hypothetical protein
MKVAAEDNKSNKIKVAAEDNKCNWRLGKYSLEAKKRLGASVYLEPQKKDYTLYL